VPASTFSPSCAGSLSKRSRVITRSNIGFDDSANSFDNDGRKQDIRQFIDDKTYKPGLGAYDRRRPADRPVDRPRKQITQLMAAEPLG